MVKRPLATLDADARTDILKELTILRGVSRTGLAKTLKTLWDKGLLKDALCDAPSDIGYRRAVKRAFDLDAMYRSGDYGPILREFVLPIVDDGKKPKSVSMWYCDPVAFLTSLCSYNKSFFLMMRAATGGDGGAQRLRLILYFDGINPTNPLAPDPQKLVMAIYYTFCELPGWLLRRQEGWFIFALVREVDIKRLRGKMSEFARIVLEIFFKPGSIFRDGFILSHGDDSQFITTDFEGIFADEKELKGCFGYMGSAGNVLCMSCMFVRNRNVTLDDPEWEYFWSTDVENRRVTKPKHIKSMLERIAAEHRITYRQKMETQFGLHYIPTGLQHCDLVFPSGPFNPLKAYLRDWMHVFVSNGVAGTTIAKIVQRLVHRSDDTRVHSVAVLQTYTSLLKMPSRERHRVEDNWFRPELMDTDHVRHFAGDVLGMVAVLYAFIVDRIDLADDPELVLIALCARTLFIIMCILRRGTMSVEIRDSLLQYILDHNNAFLDLFGSDDCKPKFHHTMHVPDDLLRLLAIISGFTTERKNQDALDETTVFVQGDFDKQATISCLHRSVQRWHHDHKRCRKAYLLTGYSRIRVVNDSEIATSSKAMLACGAVAAGDMVALVGGCIGEIIAFFELDGAFFVRASLHMPLDAEFQFDADVSDTVIIDSEKVIEPVMWYRKKKVIFAIVPNYG